VQKKRKREMRCRGARLPSKGKRGMFTTVGKVGVTDERGMSLKKRTAPFTHCCHTKVSMPLRKEGALQAIWGANRKF